MKNHQVLYNHKVQLGPGLNRSPSPNFWTKDEHQSCFQTTHLPTILNLEGRRLKRYTKPNQIYITKPNNTIEILKLAIPA